MARPHTSGDRLVSALLQLLQEREYHTLTVTDIAKRAGVSRMAFYRNFSTKEALTARLIQAVGQEAGQLLQRQNKSQGLKDYFAELFRLVQKYGTVVKNVYKANLGELILSYLNQSLFVSIKDRGYAAVDVYKARFFTGAFYNVMIQWVVSGMRETPEDIAAICSGLILAK